MCTISVQDSRAGWTAVSHKDKDKLRTCDLVSQYDIDNDTSGEMQYMHAIER